MHDIEPVATPAGHTPDGGVLVGQSSAPLGMVIFEDPQCPFSRRFERINAAHVAEAVEAGRLSVEYRMRCFLGEESVRADNALALAAEAGRFDELRKALFADQPQEHTGGFTTEDLLRFGAKVGITDPAFNSGVQEARYVEWVLRQDKRFEAQDPQGTPAAWFEGHLVEPEVLFSGDAFEELLRG